MIEGGRHLTVSQVAAILSVSERTVRRRCESGKLAAQLVTTESGKVWEIEAAAVQSADAADTNVRPTTVTSYEGADTQTITADTQTITAANAADAADTDVRTGAATPVKNDARDELIAELRENTAYLRSQIEAQRLQIEAANRATNEAHAALREALKMSNRALPASEIVSTNPTHESATQVLAADANAAPETAPEHAPDAVTTVYTPQPLSEPEKRRDKIGLRGFLLRILRG